DLWMPLETSGEAIAPNWRTDRSTRPLSIIGRLRPGVTDGQAREELRTIAGTLAADVPPAQRLSAIDVVPGTLGTGDQRRLARTCLSLLLGLVGLVLLIACANVGNLVLARVLGRRRELAVRVALGASRARLAWMLLTESGMVAILGGAVALVMSRWTSRLF